MKIFRIIDKLINLFQKYNNPIKYARKIGVHIGEDCKLVASPQWGSEPYLISIGNHTEISFDCTFITHDGSTWVFRNKEKYNDIIRYGKIEIGNNCFIGAKSIILPGVCIGNESIIGAGALVTKSIPPGEVWGGVPARFIMTTEEFAWKCLKETPEYDLSNMINNKKDEIMRLVRAGLIK